jgi:hypothetical protein
MTPSVQLQEDSSTISHQLLDHDLRIKFPALSDDSDALLYLAKRKAQISESYAAHNAFFTAYNTFTTAVGPRESATDLQMLLPALVKVPGKQKTFHQKR